MGKFAAATFSLLSTAPGIKGVICENDGDAIGADDVPLMLIPIMMTCIEMLSNCVLPSLRAYLSLLSNRQIFSMSLIENKGKFLGVKLLNQVFPKDKEEYTVKIAPRRFPSPATSLFCFSSLFKVSYCLFI